MLTNLIIFCIICFANALYIIGFNRATYFEWMNPTISYNKNNDEIDEDSKMVLWKLRYWSEKTIGEFWSKPLMTCPTCMASVHGFIPFLITYMSVYTLSPMVVIYWLFYTLTLAGLATLLNK